MGKKVSDINVLSEKTSFTVMNATVFDSKKEYYISPKEYPNYNKLIKTQNGLKLVNKWYKKQSKIDDYEFL